MTDRNITRRRLLQSTAAVGGVAAGSGVLTGFPTIWAQNIKDVVLHHVGPPVAAIPKIAEQATKDLGFTISMQATESMDLLNRFLSQSSAIDVGDVSIVFMKYLVGRNVLRAIPVGKFKEWDKVIPLFSKGVYPDGSEASTQGVAPYTVLYATGPDGQKFAEKPTEWLTGIQFLTAVGQAGLTLGRDVALRGPRNEILAVMTVEEIYERRADEAERVCGTADTRHPLAAEMAGWGRRAVSGRAGDSVGDEMRASGRLLAFAALRALAGDHDTREQVQDHVDDHPVLHRGPGRDTDEGEPVNAPQTHLVSDPDHLIVRHADGFGQLSQDVAGGGPGSAQDVHVEVGVDPRGARVRGVEVGADRLDPAPPHLPG